MILSKKELKEYLLLEGKNYQSQIGGLERRFLDESLFESNL